MSDQRTLGKVGSVLAGLAATMLAGALAVPLLWGAVWALSGQIWFPVVAGPLLVLAAAAAAWLAVLIIDGLAGRTQIRVVVATLVLLGLLRLVATLTATGTAQAQGSGWHYVAVIVGIAVMAWRFRVSDARRA